MCHLKVDPAKSGTSAGCSTTDPDADTSHWSIKVYPVPVHSTRGAFCQKWPHPACWCWSRLTPRCCHHPQPATGARLDQLKNWHAGLAGSSSSSTSSTWVPKGRECTALVEFVAAGGTKPPVEASAGGRRAKVSYQYRRRHDLSNRLKQGLPTTWFWVWTSRATQIPLRGEEEAPGACLLRRSSPLKRLQVDSRHDRRTERLSPPCIAGVDCWKIKFVFPLPFHDESDWPISELRFHHCPKASRNGKLLLDLKSPAFCPRILILALVIWPIEVDGLAKEFEGRVRVCASHDIGKLIRVDINTAEFLPGRTCLDRDIRHISRQGLGDMEKLIEMHKRNSQGPGTGEHAWCQPLAAVS